MLVGPSNNIRDMYADDSDGDGEFDVVIGSAEQGTIYYLGMADGDVDDGLDNGCDGTVDNERCATLGPLPSNDSGGCAAASGRTGVAWLLALVGVLAYRRRRLQA